MIIIHQQQRKNLKFYPSPGNYYRSQLYPALNDTFVYLGFGLQWQLENNDIPQIQKNLCLVHCDNQGKILFSYIVNQPEISSSLTTKLLIVSEKEIITIQRPQNRLLFIDLQTHQICFFYHKFKASSFKDINLHIFSETDLVCVEERYDQNQLSITYYCLPLILGAKSFAFYESKVDQFQRNMKVIKANNHSMIIWFKESLQEKFTLHVFDIRDLIGGKYNRIEFNHIIPDYNERLLVRNAWQKRRGEFLFAVQSYKLYMRNYKIKIMKLEVENNRFNQTEIKFNCPLSNQILNFSFNLGQICFMEVLNMSKTFTKIYYNVYLHNRTEEIIMIQENNNQHHNKVGYFFPSYNPYLINSISYENIENTTNYMIAVKQTRIQSLQLLDLHILLQLNQDFDDDLIKDIMELIDSVKRQDKQTISEKQQHLVEQSISQEQGDLSSSNIYADRCTSEQSMQINQPQECQKE